MNLDTNIKKFFPVIILGMLASVAYFQATGIGDYVAGSVSDGPAQRPVVVTSALGLSATKSASGNSILARNPFDSVTGPLDGSGPVEATPMTEPAPTAETVTSDPNSLEDAPKCSFGKVMLITHSSSDPAWSFASIQGKSGESKLHRIGDDVDDHQLERVAWNKVWLTNNGARCQLVVGDKAQGATVKKPSKTKKPRTARSRRGALPPELAAKIHKVSDTEFNIERSVVDAILEKQAELMKYTRLKPVKQGDKVTGLRLSRVRGGSLLDTLGLKNGDQIQSINGFNLSDPQKALEAYGRLRTANQLKLVVNRGGKPTTIDFNIQ